MPLRGFDQAHVLFDCRFPILDSQFPDYIGLGSVDRIAAPPNRNMIHIHRSPVSGVQRIARVNLKREARS